MSQGTPPIEPARSESASRGTNGKYLLHATDPQGYDVGLELDTWENHIVKEHPEMSKFFDLLEKTISEPQLIQHSTKQSETFYYYRLTGRSFYRIRDIYLSVVVRRDEDSKKGVVKTAHLLKEVRKEGETVWMKRD